MSPRTERFAKLATLLAISAVIVAIAVLHQTA
jgi:hypothetical protein